MADTETDNPSQESVPRQQAGQTPPPARSARRLQTQVVPPANTDAFATPSSENPHEPQPLAGHEPPIFGGHNPPLFVTPTTTPAEEVPDPHPVGDAAADEEVQPAPLLPGTSAELRRTLRSTPVLLGALLVVALLVTWAVQRGLPPERAIEVKIELKNFAQLDSTEAAELRADIQGKLRSYALRMAAKERLKRTDSKAPSQLLDRSLFDHTRSFDIDAEGMLHLQMDSTDPNRDLPQIAAVASVFRDAMAEREATQAQPRREALKNRQDHLAALEAQLKEVQEYNARPTPPVEISEEDQAHEQSLVTRIAQARVDLAAAERALAESVVVGNISEATPRDNSVLRRGIFIGIWGLAAGGAAVAILLAGVRTRQKRQRRGARRRAPLAEAPGGA